MKQSGILITHEGGEGSGKTTQAKLLTARFQVWGIDVMTPHEPGYTEAGEQIREILLHRKNINLTGETEVLLFSAARRQLVEEFLWPHLEKGGTLNLDRFYDSTMAYQGYGHGVSRVFIRQATNLATMGLVPDLTILYDVDPEIGLARACRDQADRLESLDLDFHHRVNRGYRMIAAANLRRFEVIDTNNMSIPEVAVQVAAIVKQRFGVGD